MLLTDFSVLTPTVEDEDIAVFSPTTLIHTIFGTCISMSSETDQTHFRLGRMSQILAIYLKFKCNWVSSISIC